MLDKLQYGRVSELGEEIVERYIHEEIDAAYVVYNEFKSVIAQRVVVERILPIVEIGEHDIASAQEPDRSTSASAQRKAASSAGVSLHPEEDPQS